MEELQREPFSVFFQDRKVYETVLPQFGVSTRDVYDAFNRVAKPKKVLLFSRFAKSSEIFHKPRLSGGQFNLVLVPDYPKDTDPVTMIHNKLEFKNYKRVAREHDSRLLAELVGMELYRENPKTFHVIVENVLGKHDGKHTLNFMAGMPANHDMFRQLYRYYNPAGPEYRPSPSAFAIPERDSQITRKSLRDHVASRA
jgi:hypothetical protein